MSAHIRDETAIKFLVSGHVSLVISLDPLLFLSLTVVLHELFVNDLLVLVTHFLSCLPFFLSLMLIILSTTMDYHDIWQTMTCNRLENHLKYNQFSMNILFFARNTASNIASNIVPTQ